MKYEVTVKMTMITDEGDELEADAVHDVLSAELNGDLDIGMDVDDPQWIQVHVNEVKFE